MAEVQYNQYTKELDKIFNDAAPKPGSGKSIRFQLVNVYQDRITGKFVCPASSSVLPVDRIVDPESGEDIDIAFITGTRPLGPNSPRSSEVLLGEILFTRGNNGMFEWYGEPNMRNVAKYLFFSNANESNIGKPWHKPPQSYIFKIVGDGGAAAQLSRDRMVDKAYAEIEKIAANPAILNTVKMGMFPGDYAQYTDEQIIIKLRQIASKDPQKILRLSVGGSGQTDMQSDIEINDFVKADLIRNNQTTKAWEFADGRRIVEIGEEENPLQALKSFFSSEAGQEVYSLLVQQSDKPKKPVAKSKAKAEKTE